YTKIIGAFLMVSSVAGLLSLLSHAFDASHRAFPAGGVMGDWFADAVSEYLNVTGGTVLLFVMLALSIILSTQFSFGRALSGAARLLRARAASLSARWNEYREIRSREKERQQIVDKHVKRAGRATGPEVAGKSEDAAATLKAARARPVVSADDEDDDEEA